MINTLGRGARRLQWARPLIFLIGLGSLAVFFCTILDVAGLGTDKYLIPSVIGTLWSAILYFLISTFHRLPAQPNANMSWFSRVKTRLNRAAFYLLGFVLVILTLFAIRTSFSMLGIWRHTF